MKLPASFRPLARQLAADELSCAPEVVAAHSGDKWFASHPPSIVALPRDAASVSKVLAFAHERSIPVTARGAGHGYVGGCVPSQGGIALSLTRFRPAHQRIDAMQTVPTISIAASSTAS